MNYLHISLDITAKSTTKGPSPKESEFVPHKNTCLVDEDDDEVHFDEFYATI